jgi:transcription elongation GreA/GreB family factor
MGASKNDGRQQEYRIVGEDEADPASGTISYLSPIARALMGGQVADTARAVPADIEIVKIA